MSGLLNKLVTNGSVQLAGTVPSNVEYAAVHVRAANPNEVDAALTVWVSLSETPAQVDLIEPNAIIPPAGRYADECGVLGPGEKIFVQAPAGVVVRIEYIHEEAQEA